MSFPFAANYFHLCSWFFKNGNFVARKFLIPRVDHLVFSFQVEPKLEANRVFIVRCRHLRMHNSFPCGHPLNIAGPDDALVAAKILMVEASFFHVGHSFEPTMRMVGEACWQSYFEMVEHQEWVKPHQMLIANDSDHRGSIAFGFPRRFEHE